MLVVLGFVMIATFMALILSKRITPVVALVLVPLAVGAVAVALGVTTGEDPLPDAVMDAVGDFAPTAALLFFAIVYFGVMIDVGLFDPLIRFIVRVAGDDPVKIVVGTALLAGAVSLDGDGSTTFIVTVSAMLPIYLRLGLSPVVLTVVANLANGVLNIVPWGGPTIRAATVLNVSPSELFTPMVPGMIAGMASVVVLAYLLGRSERARLRVSGRSLLTVGGGGGAGPDLPTEEFLDPDRPTLRPKLIWFNLGLTVAVLVLLGLDVMPLALVFMIAAAIALLVNFPRPADQVERIRAHSASIVSVVSMVFAAAVLVGVLQGTGMVGAMAQVIVAAVPDALGPWFAVITAVLSMPLTFFLTNDAFYFGILPILSEAAGAFGITPVEMARASIVGQPVHMTSPLVPAMLLLISLAKVDLADHHRKVIGRAVICSLVMLGVSVLVGAVPIG